MVRLEQIGEDIAGLVSEHEMFKNDDQPVALHFNTSSGRRT
jgi:hypothetical protein